MHNPFRFDRVGNMAMCVWELKRFAATVGGGFAATVGGGSSCSEEQLQMREPWEITLNIQRYVTVRQKNSPAALTLLRRNNKPNIRYITVHNVTSRNLNVLDMEHNRKTGP